MKRSICLIFILFLFLIPFPLFILKVGLSESVNGTSFENKYNEDFRYTTFEDKFSRIINPNEPLFNLNLTGKNTTIAFIDTGINIQHESFIRFNGIIAFHLVQLNSNSTSNESSIITDYIGHGTHVASIALGNSTKIRGIAPEASCVMVNVFENPESFSTSRNHLIEGMKWLLNYSILNPIDVVSISVGATSLIGETDEISSLVWNFTNRGIPVVASVGNSGLKGEGSVFTPGSSPFAFSVGACDYSSLIAAPSNGQGPGYNQTIKPEFLAPGIEELGADFQNNTNYISMTGASQAVPYISGLISLIKQYFNDKNLTVSPEMLKFLMILSCLPINKEYAFTPNNQNGWGVPQLNCLFNILSEFNSQSQSINKSILIPKEQFPSNTKIIKISPDRSGNYRIEIDSEDISFALLNTSADVFGNPQIISRNEKSSHLDVSLVENQSYFLAMKRVQNLLFNDISIEFEYLDFFGIITVNEFLILISIGGAIICGIWVINHKWRSMV